MRTVYLYEKIKKKDFREILKTECWQRIEKTKNQGVRRELKEKDDMIK